MSRTLMARIGYLFARGAFGALRDKMDPRKVNGGVFLGLNGVVIKSHGGTDALGFAGAIELGYDMVRHELVGAMIEPSRRCASRPRRLARPRRDARERRRGHDLVNASRSVVRGIGAYLPAQRRDQCRTCDDGRHLRRVDRAAHRHPRAPHRGRGRDDVDAGDSRPRRPRSPTPGSTPPTSTSSSSRPRRPTTRFPATATQVQAALGITTARPSTCRRSARASSSRSRPPTNFSRSGSHKRALVIGAETFSRILDWKDRTTCVLFGDGAGAVVLEAQEQRGAIARPRRAHLASALGRAAQEQALCRRRPVVDRHGRPSAHGGQEVFRHAVGMVTDVDRGRLRRDRHHAPTTSTGSCRIRPIAASSTPRADKLGIAPRQGGRDGRRARQHLGGVDSAGARRRRSRDGRIKRGDLVMIEAMGGGFTWGVGADPLVSQVHQAVEIDRTKWHEFGCADQGKISSIAIYHTVIRKDL